LILFINIQIGKLNYKLLNEIFFLFKKTKNKKKKDRVLFFYSLARRGDYMKNLTDSFVYLGHWPSAGSFGFNTDILATNPINLSVVIGVLIFFGKGVCVSCLFQE
jgi:hypothetical protein